MLHKDKKQNKSLLQVVFGFVSIVGKYYWDMKVKWSMLMHAIYSLVHSLNLNLQARTTLLNCVESTAESTQKRLMSSFFTCRSV